MIAISDSFVPSTTFGSLGIGSTFIERDCSTAVHFIKVSENSAYDFDNEELTDFDIAEWVEPHDVQMNFM